MSRDGFCEPERVLAVAGPAGMFGKARSGERVSTPRFPLSTFVSLKASLNSTNIS